MKKIVYLALCLGALASLHSCNPRAKATPGAAAKLYTEQIMNDDYDAFVRAIEFTETPAKAVKEAEAYTRSTFDADRREERREERLAERETARDLRTVHRPHVTERGGIREVEIISEEKAPDNTYDVTVRNVYNNGLVEEMKYKMVDEDRDWKIRVTDNKEVWRAVTDRGEREVMKIRDEHKRDFYKNHEGGRRRFLKDITKKGGEVEIVKTLENGQRHREVIR